MEEKQQRDILDKFLRHTIKRNYYEKNKKNKVPLIFFGIYFSFYLKSTQQIKGEKTYQFVSSILPVLTDLLLASSESQPLAQRRFPDSAAPLIKIGSSAPRDPEAERE